MSVTVNSQTAVPTSIFGVLTVSDLGFTDPELSGDILMRRSNPADVSKVQRNRANRRRRLIDGFRPVRLRRSGHSMITQTLLIHKQPMFCVLSERSLIRLGLQHDRGRKMVMMTIRNETISATRKPNPLPNNHIVICVRAPCCEF
jgi:hypothetical protein